MVVRISQLEDSFWDAVTGSMTFGYSFTKASDVAQFNLGVHVSHCTLIRSYTLDGSTISTNDQATETTQRSDLRLATTRFRSNRWFNAYFVGLESADEFGLNLRSSVGATIGRFLRQTNTTELALLGGLVASTESGRTRAQFDATIRYELISDLFWDLTFYDIYDNKPPSGSDSTTDHGVVTSLGWSF